MKTDQKSNWAKSLGLFSVIVSELMGATGLGIALGYVFQKYADAPFWIYLPTAILGFSFGIYRVYVISNRANSSDDSR